MSWTGEFDLKERLLDYSVRVVNLCQALDRNFVTEHIAKQLLRCGTSPMANYAEATQSESSKDFIHKLGICLKELQESELWILLIQRSKLLSPAKRMQPILNECTELLKILASSRRTAKANAAKKRETASSLKIKN
jgi:four helix bundle protein